jgi:2-polyprenyl-3-methyl-5-hydroxy-6-metoxy-1,4-benzoquinol methylase
MTKAERVFTDIYEQKVWGDGSGGGSVPELLGPYIQMVEDLLTATRARNVMDIGCGDGVLAAAIDWGSARYDGIEVVESVAKQAQRRRRSKSLIFRVDVLTDVDVWRYVRSDIIIIKEVLQHLDIDSIARLLDNLCKFPLILHCSAVAGIVNSQIPMGGTRTVDLRLPPFNLKGVKNVLKYKVCDTDYFCQIWRPAH